MDQLKMLMKVKKCGFPEDRNGFSCRKFDGSEADIDIWLGICKNGLAAPDDGREKYENSMLKMEGYKISDTYFVLYEGKEVGTVTAIVYDEKKQGYMHMVAAVPEVRGKGIGAYMADIAAFEFFSRGCETAVLKTDEFRVPAVKSYLRAGFLPVLYSEGMEERWSLWLKQNGYKNIDMVDEQGAFVKTLVQNDNRIKFGIFGARRGANIGYCIKKCSDRAVISAVCDMDSKKFELIKDYCEEDTVFVSSFDELLDCGCDAIVLSNYFNEHTEYAIRCLERGINVLSETTACATLKECAELTEAVEKSGKIYMLLENYGYMYPVQMLKKIYDEQKLGRAVYCEGEYVHPMSRQEYAGYTPTPNHWRANMPSCYYLTHSLAPLMRITDSMPLSVNCRSIYSDFVKIEKEGEPVKDASAVMLVGMSDSSLARITGWVKFGIKGEKYRIACADGEAETVTGDQTKVLVRYNPDFCPDVENKTVVYDSAEYFETENSKNSGHNGSDYFAVDEFTDCVINNKQPYFDVYKAVAMSACGILAWRSSLENGKEFKIPDFTDKEARDSVCNDDLSPFPDNNGVASMPCTAV